MERATAPKKLNVPLTLSTVVAIAAAYLAAAKFPHSIPLDAPRPVAAARLAGRWAVNDELGRTGTFLARDKLVGAETVFLDRAASCDVVYATDVSSKREGTAGLKRVRALQKHGCTN